MNRTNYIIVLFFLLIGFRVSGQFSSQIKKQIAIHGDSLVLDSLSVLPESISLFIGDSTINPNAYTFNENCNCLVLHEKQLIGSEVTVSYRRFPINFKKELFRKDIKQLGRDHSLPQNPFTINFSKKESGNPSDLFAGDGLSKNGSISRGISFGNNQDIVVNSNMNLQVSGKLTNDIDLLLAATDNSIPVQPDGNTQQLQEFDKVFVQLSDQQSALVVGDYQLASPKSEFLRYYKRAQGILATSSFNSGTKDNKAIFHTRLAGAVSRGKFSRNVIMGIENNQGPYKLKGAENETYIIVLSGTERIYIDGRLLTRGQENDYIIDYNTAELTFTAKQIITKDKRITAEFQYSERNYARSLVFFGEEFETNRSKTFLHVYSEQDNRNKPFQQTLTDADKRVLFNIGDTINAAFAPGWSNVEFNANEVLYKRIDTVAASGTYYGIFMLSGNPLDTLYRVKFSFVGQGRGNYRQVQSAANGKTYAWVEPQSGLPMGAYEPVIQLVTPKKKQMAIGGTDVRFGKSGQFYLEGAFSENDKNTFSPYNNNDDQGQALKVTVSDRRLIRHAKTDSVVLNPFHFFYGADYEFLQKNFSSIERFRSVEFDRDWNRNPDTLFNDQHLAGIHLGIEQKDKFLSRLSTTGFLEDGHYKGLRSQLIQQIRLKKLSVNYAGSFLGSESKNRNTLFYRHKSKLVQNLGLVSVYYLDEFENNRFIKPGTDSLLGRSYQFWEWESGIMNTDSTRNRAKIFYRERIDRFSKFISLFDAAQARNYGGSLQLSSNANHPLSITGIYRELKVLDTTLIRQKPDNTLLGRIEYAPRLWKGFIQVSLFYELGYGLEQKREFSYIQVPPGQGQYAWIDYNGDGVTQLNEFEIALFPDQAKYIRVFNPTNNYVKAGHNQFSGNLYLRPSVFIKESSGNFIRFAGRFMTQTAVRVDKKSQSDLGSIYNPFDWRLRDSLLLTSNASVRQSLFFNQSDPVAGFDLTYQNNVSKQLLLNGLEGRGLEQWEWRSRWNITKSWAIFFNAQTGSKSAFSEFFKNRNYHLKLVQVEPRLSYQPNTAFRISAIFKYDEKQNVYEGAGQKANISDIGLELRFNRLSKGSFTGRADYLLIRYNDNINTPLAFEVLNGLKPGENWTWNAGYQHNLTQHLQISFNYEGRKTPGNRMIHIGSAQARAFF